MKKIFSLFFALILFASVSQAQNTIIVGLKGGVNIASLSGADVNADLLKSTTNFVGGAFIGINLGGIALQPELLYMNKSVNADVQNVGDLNLAYFEIPILFKFYIPSLLVHPNIFAGPSFGFKTKAELSLSGVSIDADNLYKSTDIGVVVGVGIDIPFGLVSTLTVDVRYAKGLTSIGENDTDIKTGGFQAFIGYGIGF